MPQQDWVSYLYSHVEAIYQAAFNAAGQGEKAVQSAMTSAALDDRQSDIVPRQSLTLRIMPRLHRRTHPSASIGVTSEAKTTTSNEFYATFGCLGVPMIVAFIVAALTLFCTAFIQVFPVQVANALMNTTHLDNGDFWLLVEPPVSMVIISTVMLVIFGCCYVALVLFMIFFRDYAVRSVHDKPHDTKTARTSATILPRTPSKLSKTRGSLAHLSMNRSAIALRALYRLRELADVTDRSVSNPMLQDSSQWRLEENRVPVKGRCGRVLWVLHHLLHPQGIYHAYYNALLDLPKLTFQSVTLFLYLRDGFPLPLVYFYLTMLVFNWLISFYRFQHHLIDRELVISRLFYLFDLFFAVFAPIVVLAYAYHQFDMDRAIFATREKTLSPGSYDRIARLFADPVQMDVFRYGFMQFQLTTVWYVIIKATLNTFALYKWKNIIAYFVIEHEIRKISGRHGATLSTFPPPENMPSTRTSSLLQRIIRIQEKRRHLIFGMIVFLLGMIGVLTYTIVAITSSTHSCRNIPECRVISYRWVLGATETACPCRVFIDRDQAPRTFHDWINANDITDKLASVAKRGLLKTIQIINRAIPELPMDLRRCREMEQVILIYTQTKSLPDWIGEYHNLFYIHVETNFMHCPLKYLPLNMFTHMSKLHFIRFGGAAALPEFPSLTGLHALKALVFSIPRELQQLPRFDDLTSLSTLIIADATHVTTLPSLQPLKNLKTFSLFRRNAMCCNGFITGTCDLLDYQCQPRVNESLITCEAARLPEKDRQLLTNIGAFVCTKNLTSDVVDSEPTVLSTDGICNGVLYKQCYLNGLEGICYNGRMQVIHCDIFGEYKAMRQLQISCGIGTSCDPDVEAWLGCVG